MIEKYEDLDFSAVVDAKTDEEKVKAIDAVLQEKLGITTLRMQEALSAYTVANADELSQEFPNVAPLGDYSKLIEDKSKIAEFLKTEASKVEHWQIYKFGAADKDIMKNLIKFRFINDAVDDGDVMSGFVYLTFDGKIKHAFAQGEE